MRICMKYMFILAAFLVLISGCAVSTGQSIQDIVSDTPDLDPEETTEEEVVEEEAAEEEEVEEFVAETPVIHKKCRNAAILYGGCKWNDPEHSSFDLKIGSGSKDIITGTWMYITGESGGTKVVKRTEDIISKATRTYILDYDALVEELGVITRIEILPIEIIDGVEYACLNQRIYTIPATYCKNDVPIDVS